MTTAAEWFEGARPRTLGAAVAPVLVGTSAAVADADGVRWWRFVAAMIVALAIITFLPDTVLWFPRLMGYKG